MHIVLAEQHIDRCRFGFIALGRLLVKEGYKVSCCNTGSDLYFTLISKQPDFLVCPWASVYLRTFIDKYSPNTILVNTFEEQDQPLEDDSERIKFECESADVLMLWSDRHLDKFKRLCVKNRYDTELVVSGNLRHSVYSSKNSQKTFVKNSIAQREQLSVKKKWVILALDNALLYKHTKGKTYKTPKAIIKDKKKVTDIIYQLISELDRDFYEDYELIVRPHPGTDLKMLKDHLRYKDSDRYKICRSGTLTDWLIAVDFYLTHSSSSILEAWLTGCRTAIMFPSMLSDSIAKNKYLHIEENQIENISDFKKFLRFSGVEAEVLNQRKHEAIYYNFGDLNHDKVLHGYLSMFAGRKNRQPIKQRSLLKSIFKYLYLYVILKLKLIMVRLNMRVLGRPGEEARHEIIKKIELDRNIHET